MDELQAIRRLKNGEIGGLELLIARHQARAARAAFLVTQNQAQAEDVVQEAFLRFYERARYFDEQRPFEPYFLRTVVNLALNSLKKEGAGEQFDEGLGTPVIDDLLARAISVEAQVEYAQLQAEIAAALQGLPPRQRAAVVMRYYLGLSEKEMTQELSIAPGTVKWLLNAARSRLRDLLRLERSAE